MRLFQGSVHEWHLRTVQSAVQDVEYLNRPTFSQPNLASELEKIAAKYHLDVATLDKSGVKAVGRTEKRERRDYGHRGTVEVALLDIHIPFRGEPVSLQIAPSNSHVLHHDARVNNGVVSITIPDEANADKEVADFIARASENLDRLRKEVEQYEAHLLEAVKRAADHRKQAIDGEQQRDKGRSFPVQRG